MVLEGFPTSVGFVTPKNAFLRFQKTCIQKRIFEFQFVINKKPSFWKIKQMGTYFCMLTSKWIFNFYIVLNKDSILSLRNSAYSLLRWLLWTTIWGHRNVRRSPKSATQLINRSFQLVLVSELLYSSKIQSYSQFPCFRECWL